MTKIYIILLLLSNGLWAHAQNQNRISLDGKWEIIFDAGNKGVDNEWYLDKNFEQNPAKMQIDVPSCWEEVKRNYEGVAFYRRKFTIPAAWQDKILELKFDASNYKTEVWVNDQVVGFHEGGYTPFSFRIDKLVKPGEENSLMVRVVGPIIFTDQRIDGLGKQEVPLWRGAITGGIWQSVNIFATGSMQLKDVFIEPKIESNLAIFNLSVENLNMENSIATVNLKVLSKEGEVVARKSETVEMLPGNNKLLWKIQIPNAGYWSVEDPNLYQAEVGILSEGKHSDHWKSKFGMREFTITDNQFYLNGKPLYLKAAFFEGLYPVKLAYPDSREMAIKEIRLAKEAGFNMIRPWRKPAPPIWLDLCDSMGMLTVGSLVVECMTRPISTPRLPYEVENELCQTILSNRNRTCIVQWELFNEIHRPILAQMLNSMSLLARELDPTRLILDESGGWGRGANIYLPYLRTPKKFNDIHHYSGSQITEKEYNGYLAIAKTDEQMREMGLGKVNSYGKNVVPGLMSYVSELGYGSMPDLSIDNKLFETKGNPIVAPAIYHKRLAEEAERALQMTGFDKIYPNIQDFYLEQQKMHGMANKRIIEAVRCNADIKGYCVHALVAGDWVLGAGLLDLWRNPKTDVYEMTKEASGKQIVSIRVVPRNVYAEKGARLQITGVSEINTEPVSVSMKIVGENGKIVSEKKIDTPFKKGISDLIDGEVKTGKLQGHYTVVVEVTGDSGRMIASNRQSFDVFTPKQLIVPKRKLAVVDVGNQLSAFLKGKNIDFVPFNPGIDLNILVIVGKAAKNNPKYVEQVKAVRQFVENGGYAIFLEVPGKLAPGNNRKLLEVQQEALPFGAVLLSKWTTLGAWTAKSHIVIKHPIFKGLPVDEIMHGVYENVHPLTSMAKQKGKYFAGLIGYDHFPDQNIMLRGYSGPGEVWWAADVLEANIGKGKMLMSTLNILNNLGSDPVAEKILWNMISFAG